MKKLVTVFIALVSFACTSTSQEVKGLQSPTEFAETLKTAKNYQLVDVRTPEEYASGHISDAQNINFYESFADHINGLDKAKTVMVYCARGGRSGKAAKILKEKGFTVIDLDGGYTAWEEEFGRDSKE